MDRFHFGDIVLLKFPYTDGENVKKRPALIIVDSEDSDVIVCRITSKIYKTDNDIYIDGWKDSGLPLPSVVRVHKLATLNIEIIEKVLGKVESSVLKKIREVFQELII